MYLAQMALAPAHASADWLAILPEVSLALIAALLLVLELVAPRRIAWIPVLSLLGIGFVAAMVGAQLTMDNGAPPAGFFGGLLVQSAATGWLRLFFLGCAALVTHLGMVYLARRDLPRVEFFHLVLFISACFMLLVQSANFLLFFITLEALTIGFYVLVAYCRTSVASLEAGLKYLIMGGFASAMMLFGISLLYAVAGNPLLPGAAADPLSFAQLADFIALHPHHPMVLVGAGLVLCGVAFKIGAVPFQIWVPDVYQGAPTPVTAFLGVASKGAGFFVLFALLQGPFAALDHLTVPLLTVVTLLTLVFGNIAALTQRNVKRIMGLSGVAHAGIILLGVLASTKVEWAMAAVFFYLVVYALASFAVFEVMAHVAPEEDSEQDLEVYANLMRKNPLLGGTLAVGLGSLAGIPPLAGFMAKLLIFVAAFQAGLHGLLVAALFGVVVSIYYYFGWMRASLLKGIRLNDEPEPAIAEPGLGARALMITLGVLTLVFGLWQGVFDRF